MNQATFSRRFGARCLAAVGLLVALAGAQAHAGNVGVSVGIYVPGVPVYVAPPPPPPRVVYHAPGPRVIYAPPPHVVYAPPPPPRFVPPGHAKRWHRHGAPGHYGYYEPRHRR